MKKEYKAPVSEKIEFNYTHTVVASGPAEKGQTSYKCVVKPSECGKGVNENVRCF